MIVENDLNILYLLFISNLAKGIIIEIIPNKNCDIYFIYLILLFLLNLWNNNIWNNCEINDMLFKVVNISSSVVLNVSKFV